MSEFQRSKRIATWAAVATLGALAAGCGTSSGKKSAERPGKAGTTPAKHVATRGAAPGSFVVHYGSSETKPSGSSKPGQSVPASSSTRPVNRVDGTANLCADGEVDSTVRNLVGADVNCFHLKASGGYVNFWIDKQYTLRELDAHPVLGATKATVAYVNDSYNVGNKAENKDYRLAIQEGGRAVDAALGWYCSYLPSQYNLTCYRGSEAVGVNLSGAETSAGLYQEYRNVMNMALQAAAR